MPLHHLSPPATTCSQLPSPYQVTQLLQIRPPTSPTNTQSASLPQHLRHKTAQPTWTSLTPWSAQPRSPSSPDQSCTNIGAGHNTQGVAAPAQSTPCIPAQVGCATQSLARIPETLLRLQFPTQHLDAPTQPFLTLGLDLNAAVDSEGSPRRAMSRSNASPSPVVTPSSCRSRSRSRSPKRGKATPASPRRNSSPNTSNKTHRASLPGERLLHTA